MPSSFSIPPIRCSNPSVPGTAQGRASVSGLRLNGSKPSGSVLCSALKWFTIFYRGNEPRFGSIANIPIRQKHNRCHVFCCKTAGFNCNFKAISRSMSGKDDKWCVTISAINRLIEIRLFRFCWQARRRASALRVDYDKR